MKMLMCRIIAIACLLSLKSLANSDTTGVQFLNKLSWTQIREKAKKENKYIFVDCYTTWCGPCKAMDNDVYPDQKVGNFFSSKYIAVKVQMDVTPRDNETVQRWYADATKINKAYKITAYPSLLFFNPDGELVLKQAGFTGPDSLIAMASQATQPGLTYKNEYQEYDRLIDQFKNGKLNVRKMAYVINVARKLNDSTLVASVTKAYEKVLERLPKAQLYDTVHLKYLAANTNSGNSNFFKMFYPDGSQVDKIMGQNGFSAAVVDKVIKKEYTGPALTIADKANIEPDWAKLYQTISARYASSFADRGILAAKSRWYQYKEIWASYDSNLISMVNKYGLSSLDIYRSLYVSPQEERLFARDMVMNWFAWDRVFMIDASPQALQFAQQQMSGVVERSASHGLYWAYATRDTYANLFFKSGNKEQALKWEREALQYALKLQDKNEIKNCEETIEKMSK